MKKAVFIWGEGANRETLVTAETELELFAVMAKHLSPHCKWRLNDALSQPGLPCYYMVWDNNAV